MITVSPIFDRIGCARAMATTTPLSVEHAMALATELAKPEYANLTIEQKLIKLNEQLSVDNPVPQGRVPVTSISGAEFKKWCRYRLTAFTQAHPDLAQKWMLLSASTMPTISDSEEILSTSVTLAALAPAMLADGVCTQEQLDDLFTEPDPAWHPVVVAASIAETITGITGAMITFEDLG